MKNQKGAEF